MRKALLAIPLLLALAPGCSTVDLDALERGEDVSALRNELKGMAAGYSIYIAPVSVVSSEDVFTEERADRYPMYVNREKIPAEIGRCLDGVFSRVVVSKEVLDKPVLDWDGGGPAPTGATRLEEIKRVAFEQEKCDVILIPRITRFDAVFVDTTGWYWPNALFLAWYFYFPTWGIGDEIYGAQVQLEYTVESLRNDRALPGFDHVPITVDSLATDRGANGEAIPRGPRVACDDLDRGISILTDMFEIFFTPGKLDKDQWSGHVQPIMEAYARRDLAKRLARDLASRFHELDESPVLKARATAATHAVVVGVRDYKSGDPCPFADKDANAFAAWLTGDAPADEPLLARGGLERHTPAKLVHRLANDQATGAAVLAAVEETVKASRPEDTIVFYFAGRGRCGDAGSAAGAGLACADATRQSLVGSKEVISLERLAAALDGGKEHAQERVIVLDATFGAGARGADGQAGLAPDKLEAALDALAGSGVLLLASGSKAPANVLQPEQHGLLTWALLDGLTGGADPDHTGVTWERLLRHVERTTGTLSRLEADSEQHPSCVLRESERARKVLERE